MRYLWLIVLTVIVVCVAMGIVPKPNFIPAMWFWVVSWGVVGALWHWVGSVTDWWRQPRNIDSVRVD